MRKPFLFIGIGLIAAAAIWQFGLSDNMTHRYPDGWRYENDSLNTASDPDPGLPGGWPEGHSVRDDPISLANRVVTANAENAPAGMVEMTDHYVTSDPVTNAVTWEFESTIIVDSVTGQIETDDGSVAYYFFPRNLEKTAYTVYDVSSLPVSFQGEEELAGLSTYVFAFHGDIDDTETSYIPLEPNQRVFCFDYDHVYWVEPRTGEIVQAEFWCEGDWVVDIDTNERLYPVTRWGGQTSGDNLIRQVAHIKSELNRLNWLTLYIPLLLLLGGVVVGGAGLAGKVLVRKEAEQVAA